MLRTSCYHFIQLEAVFAVRLCCNARVGSSAEAHKLEAGAVENSLGEFLKEEAVRDQR